MLELVRFFFWGVRATVVTRACVDTVRAMSANGGGRGASSGGGGKAGDGTAFGVTPYPDFARPSAEECRAAVEALQRLHGVVQRNEGDSVLDALVHTILSQNTTDKTSIRAFRSLKQVRAA